VNLKIEQLFLIGEEQEDSKIDFTNSNTDVIVFLSNGDKYIASFFTLKNIKNLLKKFKSEGQFLQGKYFWKKNLILVDNCSKKNVRRIVEDILEEGSIGEIFEKISNDS